MRTLVGLVLLIALAAAYVAFKDGPSTTTLPLSVQMAGDTIALTNTGTADASDCSLTANSRFRRDNVRLPKSEPVVIPLASLIADGTRFTPGTDELDRLQVACTSPKPAEALYMPKG